MDPSQVTAIETVAKTLSVTGLLLAMIIILIRGSLVPRSIYQRSVEDNEFKDKQIDRLTLANERLARLLSNNKKGMQ